MKINPLLRTAYYILRVKPRSGFTLIETLIYSAILAIFLAASLLFINSVLSSADKLTAQNEVAANLEFVSKKMDFYLSETKSVLEPAANSSSSRLATDSSIFELVNNKVFLTLPGGSSSSITNNRVVVNNFLVENFVNEQSSSTLRISLDIQSATHLDVRLTSTLFYVTQ